MLYLYAIIDRPGEPPALGAGLGGQPLRCRGWGRVGAVVSEFAGPAPRAEADLLWRHEEVVEGLLRERAVLPVRFGTLLADEAALEELLRERHDRFVAGLARVAGRVELGLRVLWEPPAAPAAERPAGPESGRDYLLRRAAAERAAQARRQEAEAQAGELHAGLARLAAASAQRVLPSERMLLSAAYLVDRAALGDFRAAVGELGDARPELRLLCTGPWPAYNFVDAEEREGGR